MVTRGRGATTLPRISEWAFVFRIYLYTIYSQKLIKNGYLCYAMHHIIIDYASSHALVVVYIFICILGAVDAQVSAR